MGKRFVMMRGIDQYYNFTSKTWIDDGINGEVTLWSNHDDLLATVQYLVENNLIDTTDQTLRIQEVGFHYGKTGVKVSEFILKKCECDLIESAKQKLDPDEMDALLKEFQRKHSV